MSLSASNAHILLYAPTTKNPELKAYQMATGHDHPDGRDVWITRAGLREQIVLPGIPEPYRKDVLEGRALYAVGVPRGWMPSAFKRLFDPCGKVDKCPCIIDLKSEETFRWVIMSTQKEATAVIESINGTALEGLKDIRFSRALPPGKTFVLNDEFPLEKFLKWDVKETTRQTVHGHPTPPVVRKQLPPAPSQPALASPQPKSQADTRILEDTAPDNTGFVTQAASWANIVGAAAGTSRTINLYPRRPIGSGPRLRPVGRIPSVTSQTEPLINQMRLVFLLNLPDNITLTMISDAIKEGPLHSIRFGVDESERKKYAGVIFQYAKDAETFYQVLCKERVHNYPERFRFIVDVVRGDAFLADDMINLMAYPAFASRRLTIAKSKFFFLYKEADFKRLCEKTVGEGKLQCLWVYNGGNATVVFSDVRSAVLLKKELEKMSSASTEEGCFHGLQVTYSRDPCVQEINYISDLYD